MSQEQHAGRSEWYSDDKVYAFQIGQKLRFAQGYEAGQIWIVDRYKTNVLDGDQYVLVPGSDARCSFSTYPKTYLEQEGLVEIVEDPAPDSALSANHPAP